MEIIPKISAPFTLRATKTLVMPKPIKKVIVDSLSMPRPITVLALETINPEFIKPINVM